MIRIDDITLRIAGRTLLEHATASIAARERVGLVGPNGAGKTTLLKALAGEIAVDDGAIILPPRWRVGTVAQEAPDGEVTPLEAVLAADRERAALLAELDDTAAAGRIGEVHARLVEIDAHAAPARAAMILAGLGFQESEQHQPCRSFSGGWRMRVALAAALFARPDVLLLDEPTNHLDLEATLWLEGFLRSYPATLVIVSHDRDLLNKAVDRIVHVDALRLESYSGNYDRFERMRADRRQLLEAERAKQEAQRRHMQAFVDRFRYKASKARQAQSRLKALEKLAPIAELSNDPSVRFDLPQPEALAPPLISLDGVSVGYGDRAVLQGLDLRLDPEDRIALLGRNGNGKSTFVKLLAGRLQPMAGELRASAKLKVGYFAQHQADELDLSLTALEQGRRVMPKATPEQVRSHIARFGLVQQRAETKIAKLSGGEKARLLFALMCADRPNILLLDEPTNHLDIASREALVEAINGFAGAVVLITHDPHLIELTADQLWLVADGKVRGYDGDLADYRRLLRTGDGGAGLSPAETDARGNAGDQEDRDRKGGDQKAGDRKAGDRKAGRRAAAEARQQVASKRREAEGLEKSIEKLNAEKRRIEARLADPSLYDGPADRLTALQKDLHRAESAIAEAEERWLKLIEEIEGRLSAAG
ncbi:MAG: ABC-F family ATP-binding cassette domain-containing protein [Azospirillaceae bacterium]